MLLSLVLGNLSCNNSRLNLLLAVLHLLYMTEKDKVAMRVLPQIMGTWDRPVTYL